MKLRNYEKRSGILFLITVFFIAVIFWVIYSIFYKIGTYYLMNGVVFRDNLLEVIVSSDEKKILDKNGYVYISGKKYKYKINEVITDALVKDEKKYSIIYIECNLGNEKENDIINLVFMNERIRLFEIFKLIWGGD